MIVILHQGTIIAILYIELVFNISTYISISFYKFLCRRFDTIIGVIITQIDLNGVSQERVKKNKIAVN